MLKCKLFFLLLMSILGISARAQAQNNFLALNWEHYKLKNGLEVLLQPDPKQEEISVECWVKAGARNELPRKFGFAHFFEHATPYGLLNDTAASHTLRNSRTNSNAQTRLDYTRYYIQVKPEALELALRYSAERMHSDTSAIMDSTIEKHRKNVLNEMTRQETNPLWAPTATSTRQLATFGRNHPYGHGTYGTIKENEGFETNDVKEWYSKYFFTDNIVLFVVGKIDKAKTKALIEKYFAGLVRTKKRIQATIPAIKTNTVEITQPGLSSSNFLSITWAVAPYGSTDEAALELLAEVMDTRLKKTQPAIVIKSGSLELFGLYELSGQFGLFASFSNLNDSISVKKFLRQTVQDVITNRVSPDELDSAKKRTLKTKMEELKTLGFIESRTELLGEGLLYTGDPDHYVSILHKQELITVEDLQKVASRWLTKNNASLLLVAKK